MYRSLKVDTLATNPLFTTATAKDFLKVDTTADDTLIDSLIKAATQSCEIYTNRYFLNTVVTQYSDNWLGFYRLYKSPVVSLTHIKYYDTTDTLQTLAGSTYILDNVSQPARIGIAVDQELPDLADRINAVEVKYTVGYGTTSADVPDGIKQAVLLTIGNWYENRQTVITGRTATELPLSSQYLLDQYKIQVC
tara:strand:- start:6534 stop:7112 length:579 start_codon:yes stop_codon:yes gene_type:complete